MQSEALNLFQINLVFFYFTFLSVQFKYSFQPCVLVKLCCLIPFSKYQPIIDLLPPLTSAFLSHPMCFFPYFRLMCQTPDNSNVFPFPKKVRVIGGDCNQISAFVLHCFLNWFGDPHLTHYQTAETRVLSLFSPFKTRRVLVWNVTRLHPQTSGGRGRERRLNSERYNRDLMIWQRRRPWKRRW